MKIVYCNYGLAIMNCDCLKLDNGIMNCYT